MSTKTPDKCPTLTLWVVAGAVNMLKTVVEWLIVSVVMTTQARPSLRLAFLKRVVAAWTLVRSLTQS